VPITISSDQSSNPFLQAATQARDAIAAARDTQESVRTARRRMRLQGLIMSWQGRRAADSAVQAERLALILDVARDETDAPMGNIQLFEAGALRIRTAIGLSDAFLSHFAEVPGGKCACGAAFHAAAPVIVDDVNTSPLFESRDREMLLVSGIQSCQSLALTHAARKLGVFSLHYRERGIPARRQQAFKALAPEIAEAVSLAMTN
jgi:GAF domain-containing protein